MSLRYAICCAESFSLGVGYLISHLRHHGHTVKLIFDPMYHFPVEEENLLKIGLFNPDAVLFSCTTSHYQWALGFARKVKARYGYKIIFGGVHPTSVPNVVKRNGFIDDVCVGDGVAYFGYTFDPDHIFPEREDFFRELPPNVRHQTSIMTSFGCPFSCTYCLPSNLKLKMKRRTVDGCIQELQELKLRGTRVINIYDDVFTADRKWLYDFTEKYKAEVNLPFRCITHPTMVDDTVASVLRGAGCYTVAMGIQTGNEKLRKEVLNRHETNAQFLKACRAIKKYKMTLVIDHIFEIPGESDETNLESYELYKEAKPDLIHCFKLLYFPKSKIIDIAINMGYLSKDDIPRIEEGTGDVFASGEHFRVAKISPWVKKMLAIPLGGAWECLPDWIIKLALYIRIGKDFLPKSVIEKHIFYTVRKICSLL